MIVAHSNIGLYVYEDDKLFECFLNSEDCNAHSLIDIVGFQKPDFLTRAINDKNEVRGEKRLRQILSHKHFDPSVCINKDYQFPTLSIADAACKHRMAILEQLVLAFKGVQRTAVLNAVVSTIIASDSSDGLVPEGSIPQLITILFKSGFTAQEMSNILTHPLTDKTVSQTRVEAILKCPQFTCEDIRTYFVPIARRNGNAALIKLVNRFAGREAYASFFNRNQSVAASPKNLFSEAKDLLNGLMDFLLRRTKSILDTSKPHLLIESKDLLNDYTKGNSMFWRVLTLHARRKHAKVVNEVVKKIDSGEITDLTALQTELTTLRDQTLSKIDRFNKSGSCARRIEYILREIGRALDVPDSASTPLGRQEDMRRVACR